MPRLNHFIPHRLAKIRNAGIVTGDPEFKEVEKEIKINWLK